MLENSTPELLLSVALEFLKLNDRQKLQIGMKLGLINISAAALSPSLLSEKVFTEAYKQSRLFNLITEIGKVHNGSV